MSQLSSNAKRPASPPPTPPSLRSRNKRQKIGNERKNELRNLSSRACANVESIMPKISAQVAERMLPQSPRIDLSTAENWLLRDVLVSMYKQSIKAGLTTKHLSYPSGFSGDLTLTAAISSFFNSYFQPQKPVKDSHVVVAPGAATCLDSLLFNVCNPGDGVLVPGPYWNGFDFQFRVRSSVEPVVVNVDSFEETFTTSLLPALETAIRKSSIPIKAVVLTNPHNPFGQCYPVSVLKQVACFCQAHDIHFISDEVYALSTFDSPDMLNPVPFTSVLSLDLSSIDVEGSRIHVVWSTSKDFGSSGLRMVGNLTLEPEARNLPRQGCIISQDSPAVAVGCALAANTQTSALTAAATASLLTSPSLPLVLMLNSLRLGDAYHLLTTFLRKYGIQYLPASAGLFVFARLAPRAKRWEDEHSMVQRLKDAGILVSAGRNYHVTEAEKGWARITFAVGKDQLKAALPIIKTALGW